jgi:PTS system nitrogen regulatory IIA component
MFEKIFSPELINTNLESTEKDELFEEMVEMMVRSTPSIDRELALNALLAREEKMTTGIVTGIAIPHAVCDSIKEPIGVIGISRNGIDFNSLDGKPVNLIIMLLLPATDSAVHLRLMQELASVFQKQNFLRNVMEKKLSKEIFDTICAYEEDLD